MCTSNRPEKCIVKPMISISHLVLFSCLDLWALEDVVVRRHSLSHHSLSDNNQLYKSGRILQLQDIIQSTQCCISDLKDWMKNNKLRLNEDKTDMIPISARKVLNNAPLPSEICLHGTSIKFSQTVCNLGVILTRLFHLNNIFQTSAVLAILNPAESAHSVTTSLKMPQKQNSNLRVHTV